MLPAPGSLGTAPRTFDGVRGPWSQHLDVAIFTQIEIQSAMLPGDGRSVRVPHENQPQRLASRKYVL